MKITKTQLRRLIKEEMRYTENKETGRWEEASSLDEMPSFKADTYEERSAKAERNRRERSRTDLGNSGRGSAREDVEDAIQMLESERDPNGTLYQVIERLHEALAKL